MTTTFDLLNTKQALIFGAGHGIGLALVKILLKNENTCAVRALYRKKEKAQDLFGLQEKYPEKLYIVQIDANEEKELQSYANRLKEQDIKIDLMINCIGALDGESLLPERKLADISHASLTAAFKVNSIITPLIAKHFHSLLRHENTTCFVALSAKVGSIEDNQLGGWYAYRASKAALNMFIKNIALELKRNRQKTIVLAIHPGTTITELSKPHIKNTKLKLHTPEETAKHILEVINKKSICETGSFYNWNGDKIKW